MHTSMRLAILAGLCAGPMLPAHAQAPSPIAPAQTVISTYSLTKTGFGSANRVTDAGTVYVVRVDGLLARAIADHITPTNTVVDGKPLSPAKGFHAAFGASGDMEQVKPGQRFYLHNAELKDNAVVFTLISLDTIGVVAGGNSVHSRVRLYLRFPLAGGPPAQLTPQALHTLTDPIFLPENTPVTPLTVQLGQSMAEVRKMMGEPDKEVDLGAKKVLVYKDVKLTLIDDKVTDAD